jgi:hypothetical protein
MHNFNYLNKDFENSLNSLLMQRFQNFEVLFES